MWLCLPLVCLHFLHNQLNWPPQLILLCVVPPFVVYSPLRCAHMRHLWVGLWAPYHGKWRTCCSFLLLTPLPPGLIVQVCWQMIPSISVDSWYSYSIFDHSTISCAIINDCIGHLLVPGRCCCFTLHLIYLLWQLGDSFKVPVFQRLLIVMFNCVPLSYVLNGIFLCDHWGPICHHPWWCNCFWHPRWWYCDFHPHSCNYWHFPR